MKKLTVVVVTTILVFAAIMWYATECTAINDYIADLIYWFDLEDYLIPTIFGISFTLSCIAYTVGDILGTIIVEIGSALKNVFTTTKKYFTKNA